MLNHIELNGTSDARNYKQSQDSYEYTLLRKTIICVIGYEMKINIGEDSIFSLKWSMNCEDQLGIYQRMQGWVNKAMKTEVLTMTTFNFCFTFIYLFCMLYFSLTIKSSSACGAYLQPSSGRLKKTELQVQGQSRLPSETLPPKQNNNISNDK